MLKLVKNHERCVTTCWKNSILEVPVQKKLNIFQGEYCWLTSVQTPEFKKYTRKFYKDRRNGMEEILKI